jgi:thiamine-phosphate pyrophosphorylase
MIKLYPIINITPGEKPDTDLISKYLKMNADYLQIRMKNSQDSEILEITEFILGLRNSFNVKTKIIVNDNADVAFRANADGVHVGQEDGDSKTIKEKYPELIVGLSTHNISQVISANKKNVDYIGFGPVFETATKDTGCKTVLEHVYEVAERSIYPVVFIGGINVDNVDLIPKGEKIYIASISGLKQLAGVEDV